MHTRLIRLALPTFSLLVSLLVAATPAAAHCDGLDGPVVKAATRALDAKDIDIVLIWVAPADERELREAFDRTLAVRAPGGPARELADRFFFETVVRLHRTSEGAPYTGLKPAGRDLGPAIAAADRAIENGTSDALLAILSTAVREAVAARFHDVAARKNFRPQNVAAGRAWVKAYVAYIHLVEGLYLAATVTPEGHAPEPAEER